MIRLKQTKLLKRLKTINQVSDTVKGTSHHVKEHVGHSINNVSKILIPMKGW